MYEITMPKLSDSMQEGKIIAWKVKEGDAVREGDILAEIESDKATMELECFHGGTLAKILRGDGSEVRVGEVIGYIATEDEALPKRPVEKAPASAQAAEKEPAAPDRKAPSAPIRAPAELKRLAVSPYARKLASEKGVDLSRIRGTGPGGRIIARDVEMAARESAKTPQAAPAPPSPDEELPPIDVAPGEAEIEEASYRHKTQARRVTASKHVIPHFYLTRSVDVTKLFSRKEGIKQKYGATVTHLVMLACLKALRAHPAANRSYDRGRIIKWKGIHLGLAVDTPEGLTVAVLRDAQELKLRELVERTRALVERARSGKLSADERRHPTFTISNLGMFDVEQFEPIINPPSAMTLAVSSVLPSPVVRDGEIAVGQVMKLTLSCDHRIVDGVTAAKFMAELKRLLEDDAALLAGE